MTKPHVVFLGAGASAPFGFPVARKIAKDFVASQPLNVYRTFEKVKKSVQRNGFIFDAEALMQCLQGSARPHVHLKNAGPFVASMSRVQPISKLRRRTSHRNLRENLRKYFEEYVITNYYQDPPILEKQVSGVYDRLFSRISGVPSWRTSKPRFSKSIFEIFTTNYDNSLDIYLEKTGQDFTNGIRIGHDKTVTFVPYEFDQNFIKLRLFRLHGSVELSRLDNGAIISDSPPSVPGEYFGGFKIASKVMVYGLSKQIYSEPYIDLLQRLKKSLRHVSVCTVVGYSFGDPWIRQVFEEVALPQKPSKFQIRLVSKSANQVAKACRRLGPYIKPINKTIQEYLDLTS